MGAKGRKIKARLALMGVTQRELARELGVSPSNLNGIINGRRPGYKHAERLNEIISRRKRSARQ